jgi:hypothetical protein
MPIAPLDLPEPEPVDMTKAGVLEIDFSILDEFLGLPPHLACAGARQTKARSIELLIVGRGMPDHSGGEAPKPVSLVCEKLLSGETFLYFAHDPETRWRRPA